MVRRVAIGVVQDEDEDILGRVLVTLVESVGRLGVVQCQYQG